MEINSPKISERASTEQVLRKIEDHIKDVEPNSTRFKAFSDFTDLQVARAELAMGDGTTLMRQISYGLIEETIRRRKNGLPGYLRELSHAAKLFADLHHSIYGRNADNSNVSAKEGRDIKLNSGKLPKEIEYMLDTKNRAIRAANG